MTKRYYLDQFTPIGSIRLVVSEQALHGAWFHGSRLFLANLNQDHLQCLYTPILKYASAWLDAYFCVPGMVQFLLVKVQSQVFTAKCSETTSGRQ